MHMQDTPHTQRDSVRGESQGICEQKIRQGSFSDTCNAVLQKELLTDTLWKNPFQDCANATGTYLTVEIQRGKE